MLNMVGCWNDNTTARNKSSSLPFGQSIITLKVIRIMIQRALRYAFSHQARTPLYLMSFRPVSSMSSWSVHVNNTKPFNSPFFFFFFSFWKILLCLVMAPPRASSTVTAAPLFSLSLYTTKTTFWNSLFGSVNLHNNGGARSESKSIRLVPFWVIHAPNV